jgi:hypothetical protein
MALRLAGVCVKLRIPFQEKVTAMSESGFLPYLHKLVSFWVAGPPDSLQFHSPDLVPGKTIEWVVMTCFVHDEVTPVQPT